MKAIRSLSASNVCYNNYFLMSNLKPMHQVTSGKLSQKWQYYKLRLKEFIIKPDFARIGCFIWSCTFCKNDWTDETFFISTGTHTVEQLVLGTDIHLRGILNPSWKSNYICSKSEIQYEIWNIMCPVENVIKTPTHLSPTCCGFVFCDSFLVFLS